MVHFLLATQGILQDLHCRHSIICLGAAWMNRENLKRSEITCVAALDQEVSLHSDILTRMMGHTMAHIVLHTDPATVPSHILRLSMGDLVL
jgi:hypothetical protein